MKRGKTRINPTPVPTDNPKPPSRIGAPSDFSALQGFPTEPVPQPSRARRSAPLGNANPALLSPTPQPAFKAARKPPAAAPKVAEPKPRPRPAKKATGAEILKIPAAKESAPTTAAMPFEPEKEPVDPLPPAPVEKAWPAPSSHGRTVRQPRPLPMAIPALLLEPDHLPAEQPAISGPGARFVMGPAATAPSGTLGLELPESYGTEQLFLAARDPYWLLATWDLSEKQRRNYNAQSTSGSLTVRLRQAEAEGPIHLEIHTQPNASDWFIHAGLPGATLVGELGFHEKNSGQWRRISVSRAVTMPTDRVAPMAPPPRDLEPAPAVPSPVAPVATVEIDVPHPREEHVVFAIQKPAPAPRVNPPQAAPRFLDKQRFEQWMEEPAPMATPTAPPMERAFAPTWTPAKMKALDELISVEFRRRQEGSLEIEELIRNVAPPSSLELLELGEEGALRRMLGLASEGGPSSLEAAPIPPAPRGFWFKVNAELIIYGSTEPDARVSIGGRPIRLREDGSFSFRFALPDGSYQLPVVAVARDGADARAADLRFSRATEFIGHVGAHAQDAALKAPAAENL